MNIRIGYWKPDPKKPSDPLKPLQYPTGEAHGLLCSPTRGGKFRDIIAQILLSFEGSCFVIDPKGQAAAVTARYRRDVLKQEVHVLNPFKILPDYIGKIHHATYDPVQSKLDPKSDNFAADADTLMEGLMPYGQTQDYHWIDSARQLGSGIAMYLREVQAFTRSEEKVFSLPHVYAEIADVHLHNFCEDALASQASEFTKYRLSRFSEPAGDNREVRSIISSAITKLTFVANKAIANNMTGSTIDFDQMKHHPMTVYVILPGRYIAPYATWMRTITNAWADACLQEGRGSVPVLGILDEFRTAVGNLNAINTLNALGAGYGCQLLTVIQDLNQLKELYPRSWETHLAGSGFQIFFGPRDWTTSDYISSMMGMEERKKFSQSFGERVDVSETSLEQKSLLPEQIRNMASDQMLVFPMGMTALRRPYYEDPEFNGSKGQKRYDDDPYHPGPTPK